MKKKKIVLTRAELDKKFLPNVLDVIKGGTTIGIQFQNGKWLFSFYFIDKGRSLQTISHVGTDNILLALNRACATFEDKPSRFESNGLQEIMEDLLDEIDLLVGFIKCGEDLWIEKDEKSSYLFKVESFEKKFSEQTIIEAFKKMALSE